MQIAHLISPLAIAPMIDWTYPLFRVFLRLMLPRALLYTDMQTLGAIQHNAARALAYYPIEQPLALQVGGAPVVADWVAVAEQAVRAGFVELNMNLGCPSDRVLAGRFGACLMREPQAVAECIAAMKQAVTIPITVKTRIGVDEDDSYEFFQTTVTPLLAAGCDKLIVHARKAWLRGLSPKQNRTIPPVQYEYVYRIKANFPEIPVVINGNINQVDEVLAHVSHVDGVMLGRLAIDNPYALVGIHQALYPECAVLSRTALVQAYIEFLRTLPDQHTPLSFVLKPLLNLAHGIPGARAWKAALLAIRAVDDWPGFARALDCLTVLTETRGIL
jgi:tRNA-dihydrouridine synthase A